MAQAAPLKTDDGGAIDPEVSKLLQAAVEKVLDDERTKRNLERLAESHEEVSVEKVRAYLADSEQLVLGRSETMLEGWEGAKERLQLAREERTQRLKKLVTSPVLWLALGVIAALVFALVASALSEEARIGFLAGFGGTVIGGAPAIVVAFVLDPTIRARRRACSEAKERFQGAVETQTAVIVREYVNEKLVSFSTDFELLDEGGLRQMADPKREVATRSRDELSRLIGSLDSGSIGISGPRGCGKTTMIKSFTDGTTMPFSEELVGLTVAAPVKYDAREFVLHLFASLCERVLRDRPEDLARSGSRWAQARKRRWLRFGTVLSGLLIAAGLVLLEPFSISRNLGGVVLLVVGAIGAYVVSFAWLDYLEKMKADPEEDSDPDNARTKRRSAERAAKDYLQQIRYQQTYASTRSGGFKFPFGLELGADSATTLARTPWTLPEAVEEFRRFAATLTGRYVVIGIDELDKMDSDTSAREFLNNVKGVFGVQGCYFLVSVSEDAMSAFERRGLPLRDVFDSSFDEILRVDYLDLEESLNVLGGRVIGVPIAFQCLCHCLAGGLPRDLIRVTRELVEQGQRIERGKEAERARKEAGGETVIASTLATLSELANALIEAEWRGKLDGATAAWRSSGRAQPWWLSSWLQRQIEGDLGPGALRAWTLELSGEPGALDPDGAAEENDTAKARRIAVEMVAFNYYAATVLEAFDRGGGEKLPKHPELPLQLDPTMARPIETMTRAKQRFSVDPWLAWELIDRARSELDLEAWPNPRPFAAAWAN